MIAGRYKSAEYLHYHPHHQSSKQQLARIIVDFSQQAQHRQHNYHHHYHRQQRKDHHSVRRSSLQTQQQQHKYPWECHHHHHYYYDGGSHDEAVAAPIVDAHPFDDSVNYYHHPFDDAANYHHTRRARRQLPTVPTAAVTAAEPPPPALLKSAQSANALLSRNTHHKCQQQLVNEEENKVPMSSANSSSWSYRLNKAGATNNQWSQEECGGANLALHRNSHPSLFSNTETQEDRWPRTSNQQQTNFHNGTTTTCRVLPSDQQVRQQSPRPPGTQCQMIMATSPKVRALRHGTFTATGTQQRPALISQRSLQCPTGSPKLAQKKIANHRQMASVCQPSLSGNSSLENHRRKISAGAYFWASNSSPTEAFLDNYTATSFNWSPTQPTQYVPFLSNKLQHLANVRANSNPTICCRRGGVERQILRRSPNSDLAPRFQRQHQQNFDYQQQQYSQQQKPDECSRGSSFSNESTPGRNGAAGGTGAGGSSIEQDPDNIDPVYLALKQATEKYGTPAGSRRGSQNIVVMMAESLTPSPRELSQTSLQDSGTYSGNEFCGASRNHAFALGGGSTPHLHGISVGKVSSAGICGNGEGANSGSNNTCQQLTGGRRPKLSEKMKSLSLDCAEMPEPVQSGMIRQQYKSKPIRSARGRADISVQQSFDKSASPIGRPQTGGQLAAVQPAKQRRLPPVPSVATALAVNAQYHHPQQQAVIGHQQDANSNSNNNNNSSSIMHIIMHEYSSAECVLRPGDRVVVVDNGDPDWKHGFKFNDGLERLMTFPSSCVAAYHMEEQPMKLLQSCNLVEQKIRLYRDQIVFAQPNGLSEDGRLLLVRNEHSKQAQCPLQFLTLT